MTAETAISAPDTGVRNSSASPAAEAKFSRNRLPELDAIRGLAILMVISIHYFHELVRFPVAPRSAFDYFNRMLALGWAGVDLFFVLSGFLIGGILIDNRSEVNFFKPFYVRRTCRILPAYLLMLLPFAAVTLMQVHWTNPAVGEIFKGVVPLWKYFTFTNNFSFDNWGAPWMIVTWSLAIEEQFYLVLPLLVRYVQPRNLPPLLVILMLAGILTRMAALYVPSVGGMGAHKLLPCRWDALFLGVIGAWAVRRDGVLARLRRHLWSGFTVLVIFGLGAGVYAFSGQLVGTTAMVFGGYTWLGGFFLCALLLAVAMPSNRWKSFLFNAPLRWMGTYSYGVYLFHVPALWMAHALVRHRAPQIADRSDALITLAALGATLVIAFISYHAFEKHFLKLGHRCKYGSVTA